MKKIILSAVALFSFGFASAQGSEEVKFGVKAGVQFTTLTGDVEDVDGATGFYVGGLVDLPISGNFHIQPELLYSQEGADEFSVSYLRIPVLAKYYIMEGLSLQAGPQVGFKVGSEDDFVDEATKSIDFGLAAGLGYELAGGLMFDLRYNLGLSSISEVEEFDIMTSGIMIGLGYRF
ncbi:MAG: PorT family protein [Flavobacterium sp.]|nr:PorT family protein [Flavobacterium sp.]